MSSPPFALPARWLHRPTLQLETGLQGHVVAVVAWRIDCVHGRAAMVELASLAAAFEQSPVAFVSVHVGEVTSATEGRITEFLRGLPVAIPTAVDADASWLRERQADATPFLWLLDALAAVRFAGRGVPRRARVSSALHTLVGEPAAQGRVPDVPFVPHRLPPAPAMNAVAMLADGERMWLALPHRRQVVRCDRDGNCELVVGSGDWGNEDGSHDRATFAMPVGLCLHDSFVAVVDAGGHTVRSIDRETGEVETWCGSGRLGDDDMGGSYGRDQSLHSPAAAISRDGGLYIAHSGTDQLWQLDPMTGAAMAWLDGFAEPRGVAMRDDTLWVADAESGELAEVDLAHVHRNTALGGLERPVAVALTDRLVLVADLGADQVVAFDPATGRSTVWFDAAQGLSGPAAIATTANEVHVLDARGWSVAPIGEDGAPGELRTVDCSVAAGAEPGNGAAVCRAIDVREHSDVTVRIATRATASCVVDIVDEAVPTLAIARHAVADPLDGIVECLVPVADTGEGTWRVRVSCEGRSEHHLVPVRVTAEGALAVELATE